MSSGLSERPQRWKRLVPIAVISAAFAHNLYYSWLKWGDVVVDCGRELDIARQLSEGRRLYVDLRYWYGPLAPWIDSTLFRVFGVHTGVLMCSGAVCAALVCVVLYRLTRCFSSRVSATCVTVLFLYACGFAHLVPNGIFNFILPYGQCATYGILVCLAGIYFLVRYLQKERTLDFVLTLAFLVLTSLTKLELFAAVAATHFVALLGMIWAGRIQWVKAVAGYATVTALIAGIYGVLYAQVGSALFSDNLLVILHPALRPYTLRKSGLADWPRSLKEMAYSVLVMAGVGISFAIFSGIAARADSNRWRWPLGILSAACGFAAYFFLSVDYTFRFIPALGALILCALAWDGWHNPQRRAMIVPHLALWTFALACLSRLALRPVAYHYGFFMLVPSLVALGIFWQEYLPRFAAWIFRKPATRHIFTLGTCGVFAGLSAAHFEISSAAYQKHNVEVQTPFAHLWIMDRDGDYPSGRCYAEVIRLLGTLPPQAKVLTVPEGVGLMFCAGLRNPYGSGGFHPMEVSVNYDDEHLLARLKALPPDIVIRTTTDIGEFGEVFGVDYAKNTWAWILENYEPCLSLGPSNFVLIFKRKNAAFPFPDVPAELRAR